MTQDRMRIEWWDIDKVVPYENNPRHNDDAVEKVANSLREFGWKQPCVVDADGVLIAGHTRLKAAKSLGMDKVPILIAHDLTPAQAQAYRLADNKTAELATWDFEALSVELEGLEVDFDMTDFGFVSVDMPNIDNLFVDDNSADDEEEGEQPKTIKCPHCGEIIEL